MKKIYSILSLLTALNLMGQSYFDNFLDHELKKEILLNEEDGLDVPMDLDFVNRIGRTNELWVLNQGDYNGGSFTIMPDVADTALELINIYDSHNGHFMIYPSAVAMGENGNFATVQYVKNTAADATSTFMGPSLWSAGEDTFGVINQSDWASNEPLGSHMDMLHQSPFSTGLAYEEANVYWVNDGWNGNIVRYDFADDHGPGGEYHADGILTRYPEVETERVDDVASHMILDEEKKWLYIVDTGNKRVIRLDITSGERGNTLSAPNEDLADYYEMTNTTSEVIISEGLDQPAGIELVDNRLFVSDKALGKIFLYDIDNDFELLGEIVVGEGVQGIKVGIERSLYYVNSIDETLIRLAPVFVSSVDEYHESELVIYPSLNSNGILNISYNEIIKEITVFDILGKRVISIVDLASMSITVKIPELNPGTYFVQVNGVKPKRIQVL